MFYWSIKQLERHSGCDSETIIDWAAVHSCADPEDPHPGKIIGFLSGTGHDPLKTRKATKSAFNVRSKLVLQRNAN